MSEKKAKEKRKAEVGYCDKCHAQVCSCVIERIRQQENAMIVAKQAVESLDAMLQKATRERDDFMKKTEELKMRLKGKRQSEINQKMKEIDAQVARFELRNKVAIH